MDLVENEIIDFKIFDFFSSILFGEVPRVLESIGFEFKLIYATPLFIILFIFLIKLIRKPITKVSSKLPLLNYSLFYADQKDEDDDDYNNEFGKILYAQNYNLQGKPDYIYRKWFSRQLLPVEIKSGKIGLEPFPRKGDFLQLCAYFLIIEEVYGKKPKYGRLVYSDFTFIIRNKKSLRKEILSIVAEMEQMLEDGIGYEDGTISKCRYCLCRDTVCKHSKK